MQMQEKHNLSNLIYEAKKMRKLTKKIELHVLRGEK